MNIIRDEKKVLRNQKIGRYTSFAALAVLVGGFVLALNQIIASFRDPTLVTTPESERYLTLSYGAMFVGLILTQISLYFGNRWGKSPTIDEIISQKLKGLDDRYHLYHYRGPVSHLLVGPSGIWLLIPYYQKGFITFEKNRYRQHGVSWFTRLFGQEGIGRPDLDAEAALVDWERFIKKALPDEQLPPANVVLVFTHPQIQLDQMDDAPYPAITVEKLKDFVRKRAKQQVLPSEQIQRIVEALPAE
jgi:hypothetical protein